MSVIPATETNDQPTDQQLPSKFEELIDTTETYTGGLKIDLNTGKVIEYVDDLKAQWLTIDPQAKPDSDKQPDAVKINIIRSFSIEKVD